jgi:hypothetical protein
VSGGKALALAIEAELCDAAIARRLKRLPGAEPWRTVRIEEHYVLFRFPSKAEVAKGAVPGTRLVARVVEQATLVGPGMPPDPALVWGLVNWRLP